jgi:alkylhydroperoxidase family enzyme
MPRIEPIPMDQLSPELRQIVEDGVADGTYATPVPLQIFAYKTAQLQQVSMARAHLGKGGLLPPRITELLRIRSAQLGGCAPCMVSRKHDSITDEDVQCLLVPGHFELDEQERVAVEFLDLLSADPDQLDDDFYRRLGQVFTAAQIIELGFTSAQTMGIHRFIHTLDPLGTGEPIIKWSPDQVDSAL